MHRESRCGQLSYTDYWRRDASKLEEPYSVFKQSIKKHEQKIAAAIATRIIGRGETNSPLLVADIGCGDGTFFSYIATHTPDIIWRYWGIDISTWQLAAHKLRRYRTGVASIELVQGNFTFVPWKEAHLLIVANSLYGLLPDEAVELLLNNVSMMGEETPQIFVVLNSERSITSQMKSQSRYGSGLTGDSFASALFDHESVTCTRSSIRTDLHSLQDLYSLAPYLLGRNEPRFIQSTCDRLLSGDTFYEDLIFEIEWRPC